MYDWVHALLNSAEISQSGPPEAFISAPPKFEFPTADSSDFAPPASTTRSRSLRSASPAKATPAPKKGSPRKRQTRNQKEANTPSSTAASASLQNALAAAASTGDGSPVSKRAPAPKGKSQEKQDVNGEEEEEAKEEASSEAEEEEPKKPADRVKVNVESTVDSKDGVETTHTNISLDMPSGLPDLPPPEDTEQMIAKAKEMVEEATKLSEGDEETSGKPSKGLSKRKAEELAEPGEDANASDDRTPPKRARLEDRLRRERVRNRALIGVTATLALA